MAVDYSVKAPGVYIEQVPSGAAPLVGAGTSTAAFVGVFAGAGGSGAAAWTIPAAVGEVVLCTNFTDFKGKFSRQTTADGGLEPFSSDADQRTLAHAVRGFFNNGGTRCYVTRVAPGIAAAAPLFAEALQLLEAVEEIATVAAPGQTSAAWYAALDEHVNINTHGRLALFDTAETVADYANKLIFPDGLTPGNGGLLPHATPDSSFALYFPWLQVFDPGSNGSIYVPPSGHMAGLYARVDGQRGVFKAPANEAVLGVTGLKYTISPREQDKLNPQGVNCIRRLNGNILVWGARTLGGETNTEFKYLNVRRTFNFIRTTLDKGTQFAVFEPNNSLLWAKITREATAFLTGLWQSGGLFGASPKEAFYVKCDAETNPAASREAGKVVTEIGVAITRPAEFVVFRLGQLTVQS